MTIPDMVTNDGRFGLEFNHGSKYWTPMTWAEDSPTGSKIAVRGDAYEAYWNFYLWEKRVYQHRLDIPISNMTILQILDVVVG